MFYYILYMLEYTNVLLLLSYIGRSAMTFRIFGQRSLFLVNIIFLVFNTFAIILLTRNHPTHPTMQKDMTSNKEISDYDVINTSTEDEIEVNFEGDDHGVYAKVTKEERKLFSFIMRPWRVEITLKEGICGLNGDHITWSMVFVVKSAIGNTARRDVIRSTWGAVKIFDDVMFEVVFVVGTTSDENKKSKVESENRVHGDILQYDMEDIPKFVPEKTLAGMQWASILPSNWFYASIDDDIAVNINNLVDYYQNLTGNYTNSDKAIRFDDVPIVCVYNYQPKDPPARNEGSKWYMPMSEYPGKYWPKYCRGGMYTTSSKMVKKLYRVSRRTRKLYLDDVWITGFMRMKLGEGDENIVPAPWSSMPDLEYQFSDFDFSDVIAKHTWGNIASKSINVADVMADVWQIEEQKFQNRIKCKQK